MAGKKAAGKWRVLMKREEININNLYVCYCLLKRRGSAKDTGERLQRISEAFYREQEYYEQKGARRYMQAFVYGNQEAAARGFIEYGEGFRAALDEHVAPYAMEHALLLSYTLLKDAMSGARAAGKDRTGNLYRLVIIADYDLDTDNEGTALVVDWLNHLKRDNDFKVVYIDAEGNKHAGESLGRLIG